MSKKENEAVVNRFLLSTVYIIVFEMFLYFMYNLSCAKYGISILMHLAKIHWGIAIIGLGLSVYFAVRYFALKKGSLYHFVIFLVLGLTGLFLQYIPYVSSFLAAYTFRRYTLLALIYLLFYVYEIVVYFLRVNK